MIVSCKNCGKNFHKYASRVKRSKNHFCSIECKRLDLTGQNFDKIKVLEFSHIENYKTKFKCECNGCGDILFITGSELKNSNQSSCQKCKNKKYVGEISGSYFGSLKKDAKKRNLSFEITQSDIWEQFLKQDRKCNYSGINLTWQNSKYGKRGTASVDRINNKIGYTKENIQIIHKHINLMKLDHSEEYFLYLCYQVANFNKNFIQILNYKKTKKDARWKGFGDISGNHWLVIKNGSKKRKLEFSITIKYIWDLYLKQGGICALSGLPIKFESSTAKISERTASLDRIKNNIGYIEGNVQWLHKDINIMKYNFTQDYLIEICKQITKYWEGEFK